MKLLFSERLAATILLVIFALVVLFHGLVITGIIPFGIVWGGRLQTHSQMLVFETVSIALNALMFGVVAVWVGHWKAAVGAGVLRGALWLMAGLFLLNTVGNLLSTNAVEKAVFTPMTLLLALFSLRLALGPRPVVPVARL
ncbi:hypothetical protein [Hymenobacter elongatus]|uniref:Uncharacterized protein n=1 Tax=Hymenobacter elongatus TaxID=877208 RepID=A0A4Z0PPA5_9BACT|nr:hypothetical protein [Hymenobacter elongatus]TGE18368.1 hypothetical protein E5J99_05560 [Hymenobacter elongatus]